MRTKGNQNNLQSQKPLRDWTGLLLVVLIATALFGFVALVVYLFS